MRQTISMILLMTVIALVLGGCQAGSLWVAGGAEGVSPLDELPV